MRYLSLGVMALTSDKIGNVTVQAVLKATYKVTSSDQDAEKTQIKYYTGTQILMEQRQQFFLRRLQCKLRNRWS